MISARGLNGGLVSFGMVSAQLSPKAVRPPCRAERAVG